MKIAVVRSDHLGDLVLTTPLFKALSVAGHQVTVIARAPFYKILAGSPYINCLVSLDDLSPGFPKNWRNLADYLRLGHFDGVLLPYARPSQLLWASALSKSNRKIALWGGIWGRLTGHKCIRSGILENPRPYAQIVLQLGAEFEVSSGSYLPEIFLNEIETKSAKELIVQHLGTKPVICIHPGSAGSACNLSPVEYGKVVQMLVAKTDLNFVITGTANEKNLISGWPSGLVQSSRVWISFGDLDIRQFAAVISQTTLVICPSTGTLHIASALGIPTVSPFCARAGLCAKIWGNQRANAISIEPDIKNCEQSFLENKTHCDFRGEITSQQLLDASLRLLGI